MTTRLIEKWLPIAEIGIESVRERTPMTPFPAPNRLHVWWARRPLVASRAALLGSLLPDGVSRDQFLHALGIHGDAISARSIIDQARRTGKRVADPYGYDRAFRYSLNHIERGWLQKEFRRIGIQPQPTVLDPTAGGGSIPFEALRIGCQVMANDINPVASLILRATVEWPSRWHTHLYSAFIRISKEWRLRMEKRLARFFPSPLNSDQAELTYLFARTVLCEYCNRLIPLSPNWSIAPDGTGVRLVPNLRDGICDFEIVSRSAEQSDGTISDGDAQCPYPDCKRVIDSAIIKKQAQAGKMGEQLYAVAFRCPVETKTKTGKTRIRWEQRYRAPVNSDDNMSLVKSVLNEKIVEWEALDLIPSERFPEICNDDRPIQYGMPLWRDQFSPRQLLGHGYAVEVFRELISEYQDRGHLDELTKAAFVYLSFSLDKLRDYNSRLTRWHSKRETMVNTFDRHDFAFKWSYAEMALLASGLGYDWSLEQTAKCIQELVQLTHPELDVKSIVEVGNGGLFGTTPLGDLPKVHVTNQSGDSLQHIDVQSVDAIVMDPPYFANVMYAELSDFFYVWLKRTAGYIYPEFFRRSLTDKDNEAVANLAKFQGQKGAKELATKDYQQRMASIFAECRRVLKPDGILTLMFTHKATGAWDALASGLMEAGFTITASWPINTESEGSLHIKDKAAANSTIFLVCRPRPTRLTDETVYWEDVEPRVASAVRRRIEEFEKAGIKGVDLYLSCFGPALEEFAKHWPLKRGQPRAEAPKVGRRKKADDGLPFDPYSVTPEDALDAARREVKKWKLDKLLRTHRKAELDPLTEWFVLAWDAFKAPEFPYDEALRLARVVGIDLDHDVLGKVAEKKGSDVILWDSAKRAAKAALGPTDGSRALIDALHHAAHRGRTQGVEAARELLVKSGADHKPGFPAALAAVLEVLPVSSTFTHVADEAGPVAEAASDFDALEHLRRLAYSEKVAKPQQLEMWSDTPQ